MRQRAGPFIYGDGNDGKKYYVDSEHSQQRVPKCKAGNCAEPRCFRNCLTVYCDKHYPELAKCANLEDFNANAAKWKNICKGSIMNNDNDLKASLLQMDFYVLNRPFLTLLTSELSELSAVKDAMQRGCVDYHVVNDFKKRYACMIDKDEFPPTVYPLIL